MRQGKEQRKIPMKKSILAAALASLCMLTACGGDKLPEAVTDNSVDLEELEEDPAETAKDSKAKTEDKNSKSDKKDGEDKTANGKSTDTAKADASKDNSQPVSPAPANSDYLKSIMFVGDDNCLPLGETGRINKNSLFAADGVYAEDILSQSFSTSDGQSDPLTWAEKNKPAFIYIWLGLNDLKYCNDYTYYINMRDVINSLHEASPDSVIVLMQLSPVAKESSWDSENLGGDAHYDISVYNDMLRQVVSDSSIKELYYFEIEPVLGDGGGSWLSPDYDGGDGIHLSADAYNALADYISQKRFNANSSSVSDQPVSEDTEVSADENDGEEEEIVISDEVTDPDEENEDKDSDGDNAPLTNTSGDYTQDYPELYAERSSYTVGTPKVCYLTFDDGPSDNTEDVLDILDKNNIKATFFIVGKSIDNREEILKRVAESGHTVGIHTYCHDYDTIYSSVDAYLKDFEEAYDKISFITGKKPWLFRFPGGSYNSFNTDIAEELINEMNRRGFTYFDWNCATSDAAVGSDHDSCVDNFKSTLSGDYETVLMHDSKQITAEYLQEIIDYAVEQGYRFDTLDNADPVHF